jgi:GT2 family glycosyltransferase
MAAKALADGDFAAAYQLADRRCRIDPPPQAHCHVLRAEAAYNIGEKAAALADLAAALEISPHDAAAARRLFAWASGPIRRHAALNLIANDHDVATLRAAVRDLAAAGPRRLAAVAVFDQYVSGWVAWDQEQSPELTIASSEGTLTSLLSPDLFHPLSSHSLRATAFRIARPLSRTPQMISISIRDNAFFSQRMAPNLSNEALLGTLRPEKSVRSDPRPTVIVPVYGDFDATKRCLESLVTAGQLGKSYRIMIVNDASRDSKITNYLKSMSRNPDIVMLTNPINLGFVGSINLALSRLSDGDVILLNADTIVPPGFVDRLKAAAELSRDIGTVVPLSNNGAISDFPNPNKPNSLGSRDDVILIDQLAAACNKDLAIDVPNGTGFCLYVTRSCLEAVGGLSERFQRGYLEDIDLCLRARQFGFRNVCAASVYVGHAGSRSFRADKRSLVLRNLSVLDRRFPEFRSECAAYIAFDPLGPARAAIERKFLVPGDRPALILNGVGAVRAVVQARVQQIIADGKTAIVLELISHSGQLRLRFSAADHRAPQSLSFALSTAAELIDLREYLATLRPSHCEIFDPALMLACLYKTFADLKLPFDLWIVDGALGTLSRDARQRILRGARDLLVACSMAKAFVKRELRDREARLLASRLEPLQLAAPKKRRPGNNVIAIFPTRSSAREFSIIRSLALALHHRASDISIIVFGSTVDDVRLLSHGNVFVTGQTEVSELATALRPYHVGWMLTGFDRPLFGHPVVQSVKNANLPVAYLDWSKGEVPKRPGDLALDPEIEPERFAHEVVAWTAGTVG